MHPRLLASLAIAIAVAVCAAADFQFLERYASASIYGEITDAPPPNDRYSARRSTSGLSPFSATLEDEISWGTVAAGGTASHESSLQPALVTCRGFAYAHVDDESGTAAGIAESTSEFDVVFELLTPTLVELTGHLHLPPGMGPPDYANELLLERQVGGSWVTLYQARYEEEVGYSATLAPARYRLSALSQVRADSSDVEPPLLGSVSYETILQIVPEPSPLTILSLGVLLFVRWSR
ncbi:MAG: hypothetical protein AMXMBFR47_38310 [Planctomycetota bacterium]